MNIGIDIDGVLTNEDDYLLEYATKFGYENNILDVLDYNNYELKKFNWNKEEKKKYYKSKYYDNYITKERPRIFASEVINKLKEKNNIYIITARYKIKNRTGEEIINKTINWLEKNNIIYDRIIFSSNKIKQIKGYKLDLIIEDNPNTVLNYSKYTKVLLFDTRYNKHIKGKNIKRVYSWYDILRNIEKRGKNELIY